jgi:hypothetical protein
LCLADCEGFIPKVLLTKGATVYIAARSQEKSQKAIDELKEKTGNESVFFLKLDLTDLVAIKAAAEAFIGKESELDCLYNNAYVPRVLLSRKLYVLISISRSGVMYTPPEKVTEQGYDMQFGTNVLGVCIEVTYRGHYILNDMQVTFTSSNYSCLFSRRPQRTHLLGPYESSMWPLSVTREVHPRVYDGPRLCPTEMMQSRHGRSLARPGYTARANW